MNKVGAKTAASYVADIERLAAEVKAGKVAPNELEARFRALTLNDDQYKEFWDPKNAGLRIQEGKALGVIAAQMPDAVMWTLNEKYQFTAQYYALLSLVNTPPDANVARTAAAQLLEKFPDSPGAHALRNQA